MKSIENLVGDEITKTNKSSSNSFRNSNFQIYLYIMILANSYMSFLNFGLKIINSIDI